MPSQYGFQILAPYQSPFTDRFHKVDDPANHDQLLRSVQRLRGQIYLQDGAIQTQELDGDGRFRMRGDEEAWHLVLSDVNEKVIGCARYTVHPCGASFDALKLKQSALARDPEWSGKLKAAVEEDLRLASSRNHPYVEIGGWALSPEWRCTRAALEIAVGSFALANLWGGAIGACTATYRHGSASILSRLGGERLQADGVSLPAYYDPQYGCMMEILRFDYLSPDQRFNTLLNHLTEKLSQSPLLLSGAPASAFTNSLLALMAQTQRPVRMPASSAYAIDSLADEDAHCHPSFLHPGVRGRVPGSPA